MHYYGFKLGLRISQLGMIIQFHFLPTRLHDIQSMGILLKEFKGTAPADKGFIDEQRQAFMLDRHGILVVTIPRKNMKNTLPEPLLQFHRRIRKCIETVGSHLTVVG